MRDNQPDYYIPLTTSEFPQTVMLDRSGHYRVELLDPGIDVQIRGGWHVTGTEHKNITLDIVHKAPHTRSETLLRGVVEDSAELSLSGTIIVAPQAQDTNAFLTENILLLSDDARAEAIPNLEISANEVKCSHAATVTNIDDEYLFYFGARGIDPDTAKKDDCGWVFG
ncbi:SufD family Fe-S cluster assembly protein [Candidatus Woesebacteria bacterium]|nr:SufD family Fe-S cluster assembly protein [Candidatus Woesebacteria bacterium]